MQATISETGCFECLVSLGKMGPFGCVCEMWRAQRGERVRCALKFSIIKIKETRIKEMILKY